MVCASKVWDCLVGASPLLTGTVGSNSNMSHCLGVHPGSDMCNCFEQCIPYTYFACAASTLSQKIGIDYRTCTERYVTQHEMLFIHVCTENADIHRHTMIEVVDFFFNLAQNLYFKITLAFRFNLMPSSRINNKINYFAIT